MESYSYAGFDWRTRQWLGVRRSSRHVQTSCAWRSGFRYEARITTTITVTISWVDQARRRWFSSAPYSFDRGRLDDCVDKIDDCIFASVVDVAIRCGANRRDSDRNQGGRRISLQRTGFFAGTCGAGYYRLRAVYQ